MKSICLLFLAVLLISMTHAKGPGGHGGPGEQSYLIFVPSQK